jgi:hypothetical protein
LRPGTNGRLEHQVEGKDARFAQGFLACGAGKVTERCLERLRRERACILDAVICSNMIGAEILAAVRTLHHLIGKLLHMTGCDEDCLISYGGTFYLVVAFLENVERSPEVLDVPLHHGSERAVIDEPGNRPVYLGRGPDKTTSSGYLHDFFVNIARLGHSLAVHLSAGANKEWSSPRARSQFFEKQAGCGGFFSAVDDMPEDIVTSAKTIFLFRRFIW